MQKKEEYDSPRRSNNKVKKYYKIIQDQTTTSVNSLHSGFYQKNLQTLSKSLLKDHRFLYIDINDEKGYKFMKEVDQSDPEEQTQQLGNNFISRLDNLSDGNSKAVAYFFQRKHQNKKKSEALQIMSAQLKRSRDKLMKYGRKQMNSHNIKSQSPPDERVHVYRGMDFEVAMSLWQTIDRIKSKQEYEQSSQILKSSEDSLFKYYNKIATHRPTVHFQKRVSKRSNQTKLNSFLPDIMPKLNPIC